MKKVCFILVLTSSIACGQNNSYPTSGNVKIFAVDAAYAEGIAIVKPAGWSGLRLTRNDPAGGNYTGNWAIGYNANTGNDFSFSTYYSGAQYDGILHLSNSTRNVGIGTTSPSAPLHVKGSGAASHLTIETNATGEGDLSWIQAGASRAVLQVNQTSGDFEGWVYSTSWQQWMHVNRVNGNVGIGSANPSQKLTVMGTIYGKEVKVDTSVPGPDYVFDESYSLPSLESVKSYVDQNKHLPEIPSAKEMEKNGIQLGEMNILLLKKVEELTLYIIEQEKRIKALEDLSNNKEPIK